MVLKRILCLLCIFMLLIAGASCSTQNNSASGPLTISMMDYDMQLKSSVESFNKAQGKDLLKAETFYNDQGAQYAEQLKAELASGKGPDIIAIPNYLISDFSKLITNGYFYDLNKLMENDTEFKAGDYFEPVLNAGMVNGGRYFIPYAFSVNAYYTTGDMLEKYGIDPDDPFLSLDTLEQLAGEFEGMAQENEKYLMDVFDILSPYIGAQRDILYRKTSLDSSKFAGLLDKYKALKKVMGPDDQMAAEPSQRLRDGEVSFLSYPIYSFTLMNSPYEGFESQVVPELCSVAVNADNEVIAQPVGIIAINANCSDKEAAYRFIKHLLSKEEQSCEYMTGLPVNKAAYAALKENYLKNQSSGGQEPQHAEKLVKELDDLLKGTITCAMMDMDALAVLQDELLAFKEGSKSSKETAAAIEKELAAYREKPIAISEEALAKRQETGEDVPVITVWYIDYNWNVSNAIRAFSEKRKDVKIESKVCSYLSYDEGVMKMAAEIMAGEGPDIVCFTPNMFNSLCKTMESGAFCDLNDLIAKDDTFGNLDLNQAVLDAGVYHGKRYFIPLRYNMPLLASTKGVLEDNGITISDNWTMEDMKDTVLKFAGQSNEKRHFFSYNLLFASFLDFCGRSFIDYDAAQSHFQSEEFINLLELYKAIYPYILSYDEVPESEVLEQESMANGRFVMDFDERFSPEQLQLSNSIYRALLGEDLMLYPFPTMDRGGKKPVTVRTAVAVSQKCKNKEAALDFIEELLSTDIQAAFDQYGNSNITIGFPINNEALRKDMDYMVNTDTTGQYVTAGTGTRTSSYEELPLPKTLGIRVTQLAENVVAMPVIDESVADIINEGVQSFMDGKRTAREAARDIDQKVTLFLNE